VKNYFLIWDKKGIKQFNRVNNSFYIFNEIKDNLKIQKNKELMHFN